MARGYENIVGGRLRRPRGPKAPSDVIWEMSGILGFEFIGENSWKILGKRGCENIWVRKKNYFFLKIKSSPIISL